MSENGSFFSAVERLKQGTGNMFRGLKCYFQEKGNSFAKIYSNSSDSNLFRGQNLKQNCTNSLFKGDFCTG